MNKKGIDIEIDGIYCPKCNTLHPTLMWHEKYDNYLNKSQWIKVHKKSLLRFQIETSDDQVIKLYTEHLSSMGLLLADHSDKCIICSSTTQFINTSSGHFICSDECKYEDNEK